MARRLGYGIPPNWRFGVWLAMVGGGCDPAVFTSLGGSDDTQDGGERVIGDADIDPRKSSPGTGDGGEQDASGDEGNGAEEPEDQGNMDGSASTAEGGSPATVHAEEDGIVQSCAQDCTMPHAIGRCEAGECVLEACLPPAQYGNCDSDSTNGCEHDLSADIQGCGGCDRVCVAPEAGFATCEQSSCIAHAIHYGQTVVLSAQGTPHVNTSHQGCGPNEVMTGLDGYLWEDTIVDTIRVWCSSLSLSTGPEGTALQVGPSHASSEQFTGYEEGKWTPAPTFRNPYKLECPEGQVAREVRGELWYRWANPGEASNPTIKDVALRCAAPVLDANIVTFDDASPYQETGALSDISDPPREITAFHDTCFPGQVLTGFTLASAANIDLLQAECTELMLATYPGEVVVDDSTAVTPSEP